MNLEINLKGKRALVGGATSGIGFATAKKLAEFGCSITVIGRSQEKCEKTVQTLEASSGQVHEFICVDFKNLEKLRAVVKTYIDTKNEVHYWINNIGGPDAGSLLNTSIEYMDEVFRVHVLASQIILETLVPKFRQQQYGRIINVLGTSLISHITYLAPSSIRSAVLNWSKHAAMELGEFDVTVNNIMPGPVDTPELERLAQQLAEIKNTTPESIIESVVNDTILKRIAKPDEIANVILLMLSEYFNYATGSTIIMDGGMNRGL